jgi:AraC-like DNA-binding protein
MDFFRKRISKTFLRIIIYVTVTILLIVIFFSSVLYKSFEKMVLESTYDSNRKVFLQLSNNINYINDMIKNFCVIQFMSTDVRQLMLSTANEPFEIQKLINRFETNLSANSAIHSAIIYNRSIGKFYSSLRGIASNDIELEEMLRSKKAIPLLTPVTRILNEDEYYKQTEVFTYFLYEASAKTGTINGALVVNVKTDWLSGNLRKLAESGSNLIIADREGKVIADGSGKYRMFQSLEPEYINEVLNNTDMEGIAIKNINSQKRVLTYSLIPNTEWILLYDEPFDKIFANIEKIKYQTFLMTWIFAMFAVFVSIFVSNRVYSPLRKLVQQIRKSSNIAEPQKGLRDDMAFISKVFHHKEYNLESFKKSAGEIIKDNVLKSMLLENNFSANHLLGQDSGDYLTIFENDPKLLLILFKIDRNKEFSSLEKNEKTLVKFVISNLAGEILSQMCKNEIVDLGNDESVAILNIRDYESPHLETAMQKIRDIQHYVGITSGFTVSAVISDIFDDIDNLAAYYKTVKSICKYKIFFGYSSIITKEIAAGTIKIPDFKYPADIEKKLVSDLKYGNLESMIACFNGLIHSITQSGYDNFITSIMHFTHVVANSINEMNNVMIDEINMDLGSFYSNLDSMEILDDIKSVFHGFFRTVIEHKNKDKEKENKHSIVINSVKDYINSYYANKDLCLKEIAAEFKLSSAYLGKIFKEATGKSVAEFVNEVRLENAVHMLRNKDISVKDIISKIGFDSESSFYRIFKTYFGVTPNDYRINTALIDLTGK